MLMVRWWCNHNTMLKVPHTPNCGASPLSVLPLSKDASHYRGEIYDECNEVVLIGKDTALMATQSMQG